MQRKLTNVSIKLKICLVALIFALSLTGCRSEITATTTPQPSANLPPPDVRITRSPGAESTAQQYLEFWKNEDYEAMYAILAKESLASVSYEYFLKRYDNIATEFALKEILYEITSRNQSARDATVQFQLTLRSAIIGDITRNEIMNLVNEDNSWKILWDDSLILPEMAGGKYLSLERDTPIRSSIYDRYGNPLAEQRQAVAIGIWPGYVDLTDSSGRGLLSLLSNLSNYRTDTLAGLVERYQQNDPGGYLPISEIPVDQDPRRVEALSHYGAAVISQYNSRLYYGGGIAPHVIGYVSPIQKEETIIFRKLGYGPGERVGRKGLELWGEQILGGKRGGRIYLFSPEGRLVGELGSAPSEEGQEIYTTIDRDLQAQAQKAMSVFNGAIVVLERDTGRVLAMVSTPGFNPNAFEIDNYNWNTLLSAIVNDPNLPQFNRAAQGQYPLGSVFKIITMAAALESGRYTSESTYDCQYVFDELAGFPRYDWTYDHFQEDGRTQPSGLLTLPEGLIRSCNPYFWHIGLDLYRVGLTTAIADMSRGFGLGAKTGIEVIDEEAGNIPEPINDVDAINLAIGQGDMLVTPLQVARFIAAVGNGGTLYRPQLIERIQSRNGDISTTFSPETQGSLPLKPENLLLIQEAMKGVVSSQNPPGTAFRPLNDLDVPIAGKTGTATSPNGEPHAWFAGYTFAGREDKPDIAVAVIAENAGEGSEIAAPIFRRIIEIYFYGRPLKLYRWESTFDVTRSPTPIVIETITPTAQPGFINP